jgi:hypothetical protein
MKGYPTLDVTVANIFDKLALLNIPCCFSPATKHHACLCFSIGGQYMSLQIILHRVCFSYPNYGKDVHRRTSDNLHSLMHVV